MRQHGFGSITLYAAIGAALVIAGLGIALKVQSARLEAVKQEYAGFVAQVKAVGEVAQAKARAQESADKKLKEKIDNENKILRDSLAVSARRLRDASAGSGIVPSIPAAPGGSDAANFDRAEFNRALRDYFEGARRLDSEAAKLIVEGAEGIADLDSARRWAGSIGK